LQPVASFVVYQLLKVNAFPRLRRVAVAALPVKVVPVNVVEKVFDQGKAALPRERVLLTLGVILLHPIVPTVMFGVPVNPDALVAVVALPANAPVNVTAYTFAHLPVVIVPKLYVLSVVGLCVPDVIPFAPNPSAPLEVIAPHPSVPTLLMLLLHISKLLPKVVTPVAWRVPPMSNLYAGALQLIPTSPDELLSDLSVMSGTMLQPPYIVPSDTKPPTPSCNPPPIDPPYPATLKSIELL